MSLMKLLFFFLLSISLISSQSENKTSEKVGDEPSKTKTSANNTSSRQENRNKGPPLNMTNDEMDTIMLCTVVVQEIIKKSQNDIEKVEKRLNLSNTNMLYEKVGTDIFEKCNKKIDIKLVNKYFKNLTLMKDFEWEKSFDEFSKIDFDKYHNASDLTYTFEQQILMYKFNKVNELFRQKRADQREVFEAENRKIRIGQIDMDSIPLSFKLGIFLVILVLFFGGIFYFLKTLDKRPKDKKKKDKEKKKKN